ncbi:MAG: DUF5652 family protein [Candidatus Paceibacterota bacterium]|jgi:hypothetical protein
MINQYNSFFGVGGWVLVLILIWSLFWKGCSLWVAAKNNQKWWFLVFLFINTAGILEIVYIFAIVKKWSDIKEVFSKPVSSQ